MAGDGGAIGRTTKISFAIETHAPIRASDKNNQTQTRAAPARTLDPSRAAPLFIAVALAAAAATYIGTQRPGFPDHGALSAFDAADPAPSAPSAASAASVAVETDGEESALATEAAAVPDPTHDAEESAFGLVAPLEEHHDSIEPAEEAAAGPLPIESADAAEASADADPEFHTADWLTDAPALPEIEQEVAMALPTDRLVKVGRGDTLMDLLRAEGVPNDEAHAAIAALRPIYDPRKLQIGQQLAVTFGPLGTEQSRFLGLKFDAAVDRVITIGRDETGFLVDDAQKELKTELVRGEAPISSSLYVAGTDLGIPAAVMVQLIQIFSYDVDFQRDIHPGDSFSVMYENSYDDAGKAVLQGDIVYATLTLRGETMTLYRYKPGSGELDYFNRKGESVRKALLRTPVDGARLSSGFGRRHHPILGYTRMHKGVDFAAPTGTPIYAAGSGTVEMAGWHGGYGRYVRIRHINGYSTAYAHMHRFGSGIAAGTRVRQGQVIGYVGTTGRSTGPHLHYEVLQNGTQINPMGLKLPSGQKLAGAELAKFQQARTETDRNFAALTPNYRIASLEDTDDQAEGENTACATAPKETIHFGPKPEGGC